MEARARGRDALEEIVSLNADDLQIEELERRLELALLAPLQADSSDGDESAGDCGCFCPNLKICDTNCPRPPRDD